MLENYYSNLWDGNKPWYYKEKPRYSSDNQKGKYFSLFFFSVCLLIMDTRYYSGTCTLNYYCLQLDHEKLIVFTRWSQSTLFSGPLSKIFFVCFAYFRKKWSAKWMKIIVSWSWFVAFLQNWRSHFGLLNQHIFSLKLSRIRSISVNGLD